MQYPARARCKSPSISHQALDKEGVQMWVPRSGENSGLQVSGCKLVCFFEPVELERLIGPMKGFLQRIDHD